MQVESSNYDLIWVTETALAYGVQDEDDKPDSPLIWLPKSQVDIDGVAILGDVCTFIVPDWLAVEKGLA